MMMTRVPELIPFLGSQPARDVSHKPGARLPLLSARPAVTFPARRPVPISLPDEQRHDGCEQFARDCYPTSSRYVASFSSRNQATVDSDTTPDPELHPDGTDRIYAAVSNPCYFLMSLYCVAHSWSVCANMTSPIKPKYITYRNALEYDRATTIGNTHENFGEDRTRFPGDMLADRQTDRQTDRHGHHNTPLPNRGRSNN